jgi:hypothetical protein
MYELKALVIANFAGIGCISKELYHAKLEEIAKEVNREVDEEFLKEVIDILKELPCPFD